MVDKSRASDRKSRWKNFEFGGTGWRESEFRPSSSNNEVVWEGGVVFLPRRFVRQERWFVIIELIETVNCWSRKLTVARWYGKYRSFWAMCLIEIIKFRILCVDITNDFINHFFFITNYLSIRNLLFLNQYNDLQITHNSLTKK